MLLFVASAIASPHSDLCATLMSGSPQATRVERAISAGANPDKVCTWTVRQRQMSSFEKLVLTVAVPVVGMLLVADNARERSRSAAPLELAISSGNRPVVQALLRVAKVPVDLVDLAVSTGRFDLVGDLVSDGASGSIRALAGPALTQPARLDQALAIGISLHAVRSISPHSAIRTHPAAIAHALDNGLPVAALSTAFGTEGTKASVEVVFPHIDDPMVRHGLLADAARHGRWDAVFAGLATGTPCERDGEQSILGHAVSDGSATQVRRLLQAGCTLEPSDPADHPLVTAAERGHSHLLPIVGNDASSTVQGIAAARALGRGHVNVARTLYAQDAPFIDEAMLGALRASGSRQPRALEVAWSRAGPDWVDLDGHTALVLAVMENEPEAWQWLLARGARPANEPLAANPACAAAAAFFQPESWLERTLAEGVRLDVCPPTLWAKARRADHRAKLLDHGLAPTSTLLAAVVREDQIDLATRIVAAGISPTSDLLVHTLARRPRPNDAALLSLLLKAGADPNAPGGFDRSSVHEALRNERPEQLEILLAAGGSLDQVGWMGQTPLTDAIDDGDLEQVNHLLTLGASPTAPKERGTTPLTVALDRREVPIAKVLLEHGARADGKDFMGEPDLIVAIDDGLTELVPLLLEHGADPLIEGRMGRSAMRMALADNQSPTIDALITAGHPLSSEVLLHWTRQCDVTRLRNTRQDWPPTTPIGSVKRTAKKARCPDEVLTIVKNRG